jgi:hypothetical protein
MPFDSWTEPFMGLCVLLFLIVFGLIAVYVWFF